MTKNLLSIDLDVMFNCETYAPYTLHDLPPELAWEIIELIKEKEDDNIDLEPDSATVSVVKELIKINKEAPIIIIDEHDEIIEEMKDGTWNVYNADFHHDISYEGDDSEVNIENWVRHGKRKGLIKQYCWLHRTMSEHPERTYMKYFIDNIEDIDVSLAPKFDLIVICISRHFTPIKYWEELIEEILGE